MSLIFMTQSCFLAYAHTPVSAHLWGCCDGAGLNTCMRFSVNTAGFGCGLRMESVGPSRFQGLEIVDGFGKLYIFRSFGASWVGSLIAFRSGSLCLEGHEEEGMTEVPMTPPLT